MFKNPTAIPAGKLIDELGLKGTRVGGAVVSAEHGNFIVNDGTATARDVLELIEMIRQRARAERGIELETEVEVRWRMNPAPKKLNITVMLGGPSAEREVSLRSGAEVAKALRSLGHRSMNWTRATRNGACHAERTWCSSRCTGLTAKTARCSAGWRNWA